MPRAGAPSPTYGQLEQPRAGRFGHHRNWSGLAGGRGPAEGGRLWLPDDATAQAVGFPFDAVPAELLGFTGDGKKDEHDAVADSLGYAVERHCATRSPGGWGPGYWSPRGRH